LILAFLNEIGYGRISKAQFIVRYHCVIEKFSVQVPLIRMIIVEPGNDPLVELVLREELKATYPEAVMHTFSDTGHFPYLNKAISKRPGTASMLRGPRGDGTTCVLLQLSRVRQKSRRS